MIMTSPRQLLRLPRLGRTVGLAVSICLASLSAHAQSAGNGNWRAGDLCQQAISGVLPGAHPPLSLISAIGRVESGRVDAHDGNLKAWPWSVNAEGRGYVFQTKSEAVAAVLAMQAHNIASIDVGCMQVNLMYHPTAFASLDDAFDPTVNVRYAVKFLNQLYSETKDWNLAAAYYHSKTPDLALSYQQKVLAQLPGAARVQAVSTEQASLSNAWTATLGAPPSALSKQAFAVRTTARQPQQPRPHPMLFASRR